MEIRKESKGCWMLPLKEEINLSINSQIVSEWAPVLKTLTKNILYFNS